MKKLSETLTELGIAFSFPIKIKDDNGKLTYFEASNGYKQRAEYDPGGRETYYENSKGKKRGTPRIESCEGKVVEVDGIKYELKAL